MKTKPIRIEKGVPMIACGQSRSSIAEALRSMEVGDSFVIEACHASAIRQAARRNDLVVTQRELDTHHNRVWLVSKGRSEFFKAASLCGRIS